MFLIKKVAAHFDNKIAACQKKSIDDPREESITEDSTRTVKRTTEKHRGPYHFET